MKAECRRQVFDNKADCPLPSQLRREAGQADEERHTRVVCGIVADMACIAPCIAAGCFSLLLCDVLSFAAAVGARAGLHSLACDSAAEHDLQNTTRFIELGLTPGFWPTPILSTKTRGMFQRRRAAIGRNLRSQAVAGGTPVRPRQQGVQGSRRAGGPGPRLGRCCGCLGERFASI